MLQTVDEIAELLQKGAKIVDVREVDEWEESHISSAQHAPLSKLLKHDYCALPKDIPLIVHCAHGFRAQKAAQLLVNAGFKAEATTLDFDILVQAIW